jgi:hypothetical protein
MRTLFRGTKPAFALSIALMATLALMAICQSAQALALGAYVTREYASFARQVEAENEQTRRQYEIDVGDD